VTAQDREGRVAEPGEVWDLARAETKTTVAVDRAVAQDEVEAAPAVAVAQDKAAAGAGVRGKTGLRVC
jgi:hypothetical protein